MTIKTTKTVKNEEIANITIKGTVGDITLIKGKDDIFSIEQVASSKKYIVDVQEKGDTLVVNANTKQFFSFDVSFLFHKKKENNLIVTIPARMYHEVTISNSVGDIKIEDVEGKNITAKTNTGDINVNKLTAKQIELSSVLGDVNSYKTNGNTTAKTNTGKVTVIATGNLLHLEASSKLGDVRITLPEEPKDAYVKARTTLGNIKLFEKNEKEVSFGNGTYKISGKTSTGDVTIDSNK